MREEGEGGGGGGEREGRKGEEEGERGRGGRGGEEREEGGGGERGRRRGREQQHVYVGIHHVCHCCCALQALYDSEGKSTALAINAENKTKNRFLNICVCK